MQYQLVSSSLDTQHKKLRKLCLRGYDKRSTPFLDFLISESYEVSNLLQKGALFEFLAPIVAEKISFKVDWSSCHFSQNCNNVWFK